MIPDRRRMRYFQGRKIGLFLVMTHVHFGHGTNMPQNVDPCNSDYKDLCNDVYLYVLDQLIRIILSQFSLGDVAS